MVIEKGEIWKALPLYALLFLAVFLLTFFHYSPPDDITGLSVDGSQGEVDLCINHPPQMSAIPDQLVYVNETFSYAVNASDVDNHTLTFFDDTGLFDIDPVTGVMSFTAAASQIGKHDIIITARDQLNCSNSNVTDVFNLEVGILQQAQPKSSGGGGGGGGSSRRFQPAIDESEVDLNQSFEASVRALTFLLARYEFIKSSLDFKNNDLEEQLHLHFRLIGQISGSIILETETLTINPNGTSTLDFLILANKPPGDYDGILQVTSEKDSLDIPIKLIIKDNVKTSEETLDISAIILNPVVAPGENLQLDIKMRKVPIISDDPVIGLNRFLVSPLTELTLQFVTGAATRLPDYDPLIINNSIFEEEEFEISETVQLLKEIPLPDNLPPGDYLFSLTTVYQGQVIPTVLKFKVQPKSFQMTPEVRNSILLILSILIPLLLLTYTIIRKHHKAVVEKSLIKGTLPKPGNDLIALGMVTGEKNLVTGIKRDDLTSHTVIAGATGMGKSIAGRVIAENVAKQEIPVVVFDPTRQWSGFLQACESKKLLRMYKKHGLEKPEGFSGRLIVPGSPYEKLPFQEIQRRPGAYVVSLPFKGEDLVLYVVGVIEQLFSAQLKESSKLRLLLVFDEVHRLLPRYGGNMNAIYQLERAIREFRKWGIGVILISQLMDDFTGAIEANINTQIQLRTGDRNDLARIHDLFGDRYTQLISKLRVGQGLVTNSEYNKGQPYPLTMRPPLSSPQAMDKKTLAEYECLLPEVEKSIYLILSVESYKKSLATDLWIDLDILLSELNDGFSLGARKLLKKLNKKIAVAWKKIGRKAPRYHKERFSAGQLALVSSRATRKHQQAIGKKIKGLQKLYKQARRKAQKSDSRSAFALVEQARKHLEAAKHSKDNQDIRKALRTLKKLDAKSLRKKSTSSKKKKKSKKSKSPKKELKKVKPKAQKPPKTEEQQSLEEWRKEVEEQISSEQDQEELATSEGSNIKRQSD